MEELDKLIDKLIDLKCDIVERDKLICSNKLYCIHKDNKLSKVNINRRFREVKHDLNEIYKKNK